MQGGAVDQPLAIARDVLELRAYAQAKEALDRAESKLDVPRTPMVKRVWDVMLEIKRRRSAED